MEEKSQAGVEYILLIGGVVLIVAVITILLRTQTFAPVEKTTAQNASEIRNVIKNISG